MLILGALAFGALRPLFGLLHELTIAGLSALLRSVVELPVWPWLIQRLPVDPVYTLALVESAGHITARGLGVPGAPGAALHGLMPRAFVSPDLVTGPWVAAVLEPGATVLARALVSFGADVCLLGVGLVLFLMGLCGRPWLAVCGGLQQAHIVLYRFLAGGVSVRDIEASGLPFAASSFLSDPNARAPWFTTGLAGLPPPLISAAIGLLLTGLAYGLVAGLFGLLLLVRRLRDRSRQREGSPPHRYPTELAPTAFLACGVFVVAVSPLGGFAKAQTCLLQDRGLTASPRTNPVPAGPVLPAAAAPGLDRDRPVAVRFIGDHYHYALLVGGAPTVVRGMGYNVQYGALDPAERAARYDRDFAQLRQANVNVLFGWFPEVFGEQMLAKAHEYGLGVGMPYELNQDLDYDDPALRARLTADVLAWVARYKDDPAVWFWTPGNEVIHRLIFPSWLKHQSDPAREARATSFARFYVGLIDQIHAVDPDHPIIYRDAEDVYLARIREALLSDGKPRPWFAYGTNVYTGRLGEILAGWPNKGLDAPLLVAEFSPGGTGPVDRPQGLRSMWSTIRSYPDWVIGGAVYTWTTDGPEELDRVFGLVDGAGQARDGSLAAVADFYRDVNP